MVIVSDTSPISNLIQIGRLDILKELFSSIVVPPGVHSEIIKLEKLGFDIDKYKEAFWINLVLPADSAKVRELRKEIDQGESEAIVLAEELNADLLIIDERLGTRIAKERGLNTIGLLGLLIRAKENSILTNVKPILLELEEIGFWMDENLKLKILELVGE